MSDIKKRWNVFRQDGAEVANLTGALKIRETTARILINRGFAEPEKAREFLNKSRGLLHDPFLMSGMSEAVERIRGAFENNEKVMIYGDYDVDGITSTCLLYIYFKNAGLDARYYIPDRFDDGYGLNNDAIKKAAGNNINLIITVDCGITAHGEAERARELGIDLIITDHHECPDMLPEAASVINPKQPGCAYPFKELAGVGVAFKLASAYDQKYAGDFDFNYYSEFAAMGTIADMTPLVGENRVLADVGLKSMRESKNHGVRALLDSYYKFKGNKGASSDIISYYIAPRINAAGRLYKPDRAAELFLADSRAQADMIADELNRLNKRRQDTEKEIFAQAEADMAETSGNKRVCVLCRDEWNQGIIGIAASKLTEKYNKSFILLARDSSGIYKGSCRSADNINITEALKSCGDILLNYGGHGKAAGLSIEHANIEKLDSRLNKYLEDSNTGTDSEKIYGIECVIKAEDFDCTPIRELEVLEPFGPGNPAPLFMIEKCKIINITPMGENKHLRLELRDIKSFEAVYFNMEPKNFNFEQFDLIDIACSAGINEYAGRERAQFIIRDARYSGQAKLGLYNYFIQASGAAGAADFPGRCDMPDIPDPDIPDREDFKSVYNFLLNFLQKDIWYEKEYNIDRIYGRLPDYKNISGFKFRVILDIFAETGIIDIERDLYFIKKIRINTQTKKIDLEESDIYIKLKRLAADRGISE